MAVAYPVYIHGLVARARHLDSVLHVAQWLRHYLTISRRRQGDYKPIFTEPKAK
jgi:hypothetical protein